MTKYKYDFKFIESELDKGKTYQQIADFYGCSRPVLWNWYRTRKRKEIISRGGVDDLIRENKYLKSKITKIESILNKNT